MAESFMIDAAGVEKEVKTLRKAMIEDDEEVCRITFMEKSGHLNPSFFF